MLILLKNLPNYFKDSIFKCFFKEHNRLLFFKKKQFFSQHRMIESVNLEEKITIKDITNPFRLKKELNYTAVKGIINLFRL